MEATLSILIPLLILGFSMIFFYRLKYRNPDVGETKVSNYLEVPTPPVLDKQHPIKLNTINLALNHESLINYISFNLGIVSETAIKSALREKGWEEETIVLAIKLAKNWPPA